MSWHFLERWIEKANQHSTLVGKFWITFLIVCRMVIVASVGDRVYSDEQTEFKCNTMQPGCTNVCFNKFSPISHLRFWSFQILLVATPSVMYIVYSGHNQKKTKKSKNKKHLRKKLTALAAEQSKYRNHGQQLSGKEAGDEDINMNANNNTEMHSTKRQQKNGKISPGVNSNRSTKHVSCRTKDVRDGKGGRKNNQNTAEENLSDSGGNSKNVLSTLINYKYETDIDEYVAGDSGKNQQAPWQERRWDSIMQVAENGNINGNGLWKKPKEHKSEHTNKRHHYPESEKSLVVKGKNSNLNADVILWIPSSSDDENRNGEGGKCRNAGQNSLTEVDMHQNTDMFCEDNVVAVDKEMLEMGKDNYIIPYDPAPPQYPGNDDHWSMKEKKKRTNHGGKRYLPQLKIIRTRTRKPRFTRHFHLYLLSVFSRLALELAFLLLQIKLFGFSVSESYKCEQAPCPNIVDCFPSRPMEKTIFLYFMLIYTCLCVLLNLMEFKYLIWVYIFGRPALIAKTSVDHDKDGTRIIYDKNGEPRYTARFVDGEEVFTDLNDEDIESLYGGGLFNGIYRYGYNDVGLRKRQSKPLEKCNVKSMGPDLHLIDRLQHRNQLQLEMELDAERDEREDYDLELALNEANDDIIEMEMDAGSVGGNDDFS